MSGEMRPRASSSRAGNLLAAAAAALSGRLVRTTRADVAAMLPAAAGIEYAKATTMPRDQVGQAINPARRERRRIAAAFLEEHGRRMSVKDWKREKRKARAGLPSVLDLNAMVPGAL